MSDRHVDPEALEKIVAAAVPGARLVGTRAFRGGLETVTMQLEFASHPPLVARVYTREDQRDGVAASRYWAAITGLSSSDLPVPAPVYIDPTGALIGVPVLVITRMPGEPSPPPTNRTAWIGELAGGLARIHSFDAASFPSSFRRGESAVDHAARLVRRHSPEIAGELGSEVAAALVASAPRAGTAQPTLIHGDYWFGNTLWSEGGGPRPRLSAILDWSAARLADPAFDLASIRMDLAIVLGGDAGELFLERYGERGSLPEHQSFWDLIVGIAGLALVDEWLPTYHALGWTHLTADDARTRLDGFVRRALARI
jgi:aminoglycoside phosphotransferase (APT) family kinase protein